MRPGFPRADIRSATLLTGLSRSGLSASSALRRCGSAMPGCPSPMSSARCWMVSRCPNTAVTSPRFSTPTKQQRTVWTSNVSPTTPPGWTRLPSSVWDGSWKHHGAGSPVTDRLASLPVSGYRMLDPTARAGGRATDAGWSRRTFRGWLIHETSSNTSTGSASTSRHSLGGA